MRFNIIIILFFVLFITSCSLNDSASTDSMLPIDDTFNLDTNKVILDYPKFNRDLFLTIPSIEINYGTKTRIDLSDYVISNKLDITFPDTDKILVENKNDSLYLGASEDIDDILISSFIINGEPIDILLYIRSSETKTNNRTSDNQIIKDNFKIVNDELVLNYIYIAQDTHSNLVVDDTFVFLGNTALDKKFYHVFNDKIRIILPKYATDTTLRIFSMSKEGNPIRENFTIISGGKPLLVSEYPSSIYFSNIYHLVVDRFKNGDNNNIDNSHPIEEQLSFLGGDIQGINDKIDSKYFNRLGVKNLLISPLYQNPGTSSRMLSPPYRKYMSFHGNAPINHRDIDRRFGTSDELKHLVKNAKSKQIGVIGSIITGYTHINHQYRESDRSWYLNEFLYDDKSLPLLDLNNINVIKKITHDALYWINEFDLHGYVAISSNQESQEFYKYLNRVIRAGSSTNKFSIIQYPNNLVVTNPNLNKFDSSYNMNLYKQGRKHFSGLETNFYLLNNSIKTNLSINNSINKLLTTTGIPGEARFVSVAEGHCSFENNSDNNIYINPPQQPKDPISYEKLFMFHMMNFSLPGIPSIYYGDEYGQAGSSYFDSMRKMKFQGELSILESNLKNKIIKLNDLRSKFTALSLGDFIVLREGENFTVWMKSYYNEKLIIIMNMQDKEINLNIPLPFKTYKMTSLLSNQVVKLNDYNMAKIVVPPFKSDIFILDTKIKNY